MRPTAAYFCYSNCLWQAHFILYLWVENPLIPGPLLFSLPSWWLPPILCVCVCFPFSFPPRKGYQVPSFGLYFPWICSPPVLCSAVSHFVSQALVSAGFWQTPGLWKDRRVIVESEKERIHVIFPSTSLSWASPQPLTISLLWLQLLPSGRYSTFWLVTLVLGLH